MTSVLINKCLVMITNVYNKIRLQVVYREVLTVLNMYCFHTKKPIKRR